MPVPGSSVLFFGTYDERSHPRVRTLREGLSASGFTTSTLNAPLGFGTDARVKMLQRPAFLAALVLVVAWRWATLVLRFLVDRPRPDVVVVGYMGHLDVHLARRLFPRSVIVLDHLIGLGDTAADRRLGGRRRVDAALAAVDRAALTAADLVLVDTEEHRDHLVAGAGEAIVVRVGAPVEYFCARREPRERSGEPLQVIFYGLYTPLQGAVTICEAIGLLAAEPRIQFLMVGSGQDKDAAMAAAGASTTVTWTDWVDPHDLPGVLAAHDVCLGIFGTSPKAQRVVPNKVYQGAAAGLAIVTSDTPCQRQALDQAAVFVPPGDPAALADALRALAAEPGRVGELKREVCRLADSEFSPAACVAPLAHRLAGR